MNEEYNQRISNLASGLVSFEKKFNKKIISETSVINSIKNITKKYNEQGQDLILKSLEEQADLSPSELLNGTGEINETALTEAVSYAINTANQKGIDIIKSQQINAEKSTGTAMEKTILTMALIDKMNTNFDSLSNSEINQLILGYTELSDKDRENFNKKFYNKVLVNPNLSEKDRKEIEQNYQTVTFNDIYIKALSSLKVNPKTVSLESMIDEIEKIFPDLEKEFPNLEFKKEDIEKLCKERLGCSSEQLKNESQETTERTQEIVIIRYFNAAIEEGRVDDAKKILEENKNLKAIQQIMLKNPNINKDTVINIEDYYVNSENGARYNVSKMTVVTLADQEESEGALKTIQQDKQVTLINQEESNEEKLQDKISQEVEQLPVALAKLNISKEDISGALLQYIDTFKNLDQEDIEEITTLQDEELQATLQEIFIEDGMNVEIANILSSINYNGKFQQILTSPEIRTTFLEQFDQIIEQGIDTKQPLHLDGELAQIFSKYFEENAVDMNVSAIELQKERATEQAQQPTHEEQPQELSPDEQPKTEKLEQAAPPTSGNPTTPEEHIQENASLHEQEAIEEPHQNTALVKPDNSFIGKVRRVFANMKDMKNKDNSKGFFSRLGASFKTVFGNKEEYFEGQDDIAGVATTEITTEPKQPLSFDEQLQQGIDLSKINQVSQLASQQKGQVLTPKGAKVSEDRDDDDLTQ